MIPLPQIPNMSSVSPDSLLRDEHVRDYVHAAQYIAALWAWKLIFAGLVTVVVFVFWYIFKDRLKEWWDGKTWKRNDEYRRLDLVYIYEWGVIGCIEYIGNNGTVMTTYTIDELNKVTGGKSIIISNAELRQMHIARFKPHIGDPKELPKFIIDDLRAKKK